MGSVSRIVDHMTRPIRRRVAVMVNRAVVSLVHDAHKMQELQLKVLAEETIDGVEHFQPFGHTAHPVKGAEAVLLAVGGDRSHSIAVVVDDRRYRPKNLKEGESQTYNAYGEYVYLREDGTLVLNARSKVEVNAPEVEANCETAQINASTSATVETQTLTVKASAECLFDTPLLKCTGDIQDNAGGGGGGATMSEMRDTFNEHNHDENDNGGPTDEPNQQMGDS